MWLQERESTKMRYFVSNISILNKFVHTLNIYMKFDPKADPVL